MRYPHLPAYGPTEAHADEDARPDVVVRVAYALDREQLLAALSIGFTELDPDRAPEDLTVDEVRREVEGWLAAQGIIELERYVIQGQLTAYPPKQQAVMDALAAALVRAYPPPPAEEPDTGPRYGDGTVNVHTRDAGRITLREPRWCIGEHRGGEYRVDVHHMGATQHTRFHTPMGPAYVALSAAQSPLSSQPQPELHAEVSGSWSMTCDTHVARAADALEEMAAHLRGQQALLAQLEDGGPR
ncbi:DUF6907 domain-containing protein [Streptomyces spectabilis]|uniref:Uncharacterized protein n=1 Tax=Streptomyces spectabilis TaxID=68270 RepID=A0A5P2X9X1_STRST|nr:hypothetical protein [Streptomyces spectabilis]MBB5103267.1 hypothetical protein [Streptomyces spectabilis]MCI3902458.1 hypothetical protein [Streptomyces spectabilis]QEV59800.1 hypothetical protein CP982_14510 [Streptomyces spectabilis]GGV13747.1 hypothetical protein GCM10010245_23970 [Streptomyces spectabilis]